MRTRRRGGRDEHRKCSGRIFQEEVAVRKVTVKQELGVALIQMHVAKASRTKEAAVGDGACGHENRDADQARPDRMPLVRDATGQGWSSLAAAPAAGGQAEAPESTTWVPAWKSRSWSSSPAAYSCTRI